ncbi:PE family protein [Mycobacterium asiaticum]|uniref:PE family protein n=1 Tax=Mycobacterium asiaticum TaxID=1790 RepID=UPI0007EFAC6F|nr:hypothetical protein A9W94_29235 [Mycobacterium asiaticum]
MAQLLEVSVSNVTVGPVAVMAAASDLTNLGSTISAAQAAAATSTTRVVAAAQDEVSTAIAALFGGHGQQFQAISARVGALYDQFVAALTGGAASYVEAEAANVLGLILGDQSAALGAAAAAPAAEGGIWTVFEKLAEFLGRAAGAQVDRNLWLQRVGNDLANTARQTRQILTSGLQLAAKDGIKVFTDGKDFLISGGKFAGLYSAERFIERFEDPRWLSEVPWRRDFTIDFDPQYLRSLVGPEVQVFARGEGLAQSYFTKVGNEIYQIETDVQGQVISQINKTTELLSRNLFADASLLREVVKDANRVIAEAAQESLRQTEEASRRLAEQAFKQAQGVIEEARQEFFRQNRMYF